MNTIKKLISLFLLLNIVITYASNIESRSVKSILLNCGETFYDTGGANGNYSDNENYTITICPDNSGELLTVSFISFNIENSYDFLRVYDGSDNSVLIGEFTGSNSPGSITSTITNGGCLTFEFVSDFSINSSGWEATISCELPPSCSTPTNFILDDVTENSAFLFIEDSINSSWEIEYGENGFVQGTGTIITTSLDFNEITGLLAGTTYNAYVRAICDTNDYSLWSPVLEFTTDYVVQQPVCGGMFYDTGGQNANYGNNENYTITICPDNAGEIVIADFSYFNLESNYDFLSIYDGDTDNILIGQYTGLNSPGYVLATLANGGCLTFVFTSDFSVNKSGWEASIACDIPPSCLPPDNFIIDGVIDTSVFLFIEDNTNSEWEIEYGLQGFIQGTGTVVNTSSDFFEITGLLTGTTYDVFISAICDVDDNSIWISGNTFTTTGVASINEFNLDAITIFPNPVDNVLNISLDKSISNTSIDIFNMQGQKLYTNKTTNKILTVNTSKFDVGLYILSIKTDDKSLIKKFIKK